jgi:hypothetical protein
MHMTVTSTAAFVDDATVIRCIRSVQTQSFASRRHVYFLADASEAELARFEQARDPRVELRTAVYPLAHTLANLWPLWQSLPDDEIIVWLDGDDYLATEHALEVVARAHAGGALATYGQFVWHDGSIGFAGPVGNNPRAEPWRATHLRTFRAGLAKRIREEDLKMPDGQWTFITDQPVMLAVVEMAGANAVFVPNVLCVYTVLNLRAELTRHDPAYVERERAEVARVRALPRYAKLTTADYLRILQSNAR